MNAIQPNTLFTSHSGGLFGTFLVRHVLGDTVIFQRESNFMEVWQLSKKYLESKLAEGKLSIVDANVSYNGVA